MAQDNDIITQADALMRRHRSFVARVAEVANPAATPDAPDNAENDSEIPLLTEVVDAAAKAMADTPHDIDGVLKALREDVESELSDWLVEVLPAAVANASQNILTELDAKARHTLLPRLLEKLEARRNADQGSESPSV
jgi:Lon protease-like protein